jgi:hypothetical protein
MRRKVSDNDINDDSISGFRGEVKFLSAMHKLQNEDGSRGSV